MPNKRHQRRTTQAYPLGYNGAFTWNTKTRTLCFMRAGDEKADREEMRAAKGFLVEGDDIKRLYQVLHAHFMQPKNATRNWDPDLPKPITTWAARSSEDDTPGGVDGSGPQ